MSHSCCKKGSSNSQPFLGAIRPCMVLNIYKEELDNLDMVAVANEFVSKNEHRNQVFGNVLLLLIFCFNTCSFVMLSIT